MSKGFGWRSSLLGLFDGSNVMRSSRCGRTATTVVDVVCEFQTESELDTFVLDNVDNNDTIIRYILNELELHDIHEKEYCRLHCLDHIINLAVQDFIFDQNLEK